MAATDKEIFSEVHEARNNAFPTFKEKWDEAEENAKFMRMLQYSDQQLKKMTAQDRVPYVLDFLTQPMNTYLGEERDSRTKIKFLATQFEHELKVELCNALLDYIMRVNRWTWLQSDVFSDGIIEKCGVIGYEWSTLRDPAGALEMFRVPQRQFMWDTNRREFDLERSSWASRARLYTKPDLKAKKPGFEKEIDGLSLSGGELDDLHLSTDYFKNITDSKLEAVALVEFFKRVWRTKYYLHDGQLFLPGYYDKRGEAEAAAAKMLAPHLAQQGAAPPPPVKVIDRSTATVVKSEIASNIVFEREKELEEPFYPFSAYYPFWADGQYWAPLDLFKDAQRFLNKTFSMVDHQMMTSQKGLLLIDERVPGATAKALIEMWSKTGGAMRAPNVSADWYQYIKPESFDPRLLQAIEMVHGNIQMKAGGANYLGQTQSAAESGVAVERRIGRAAMSSFVIYDNLDRFKFDVGTKLAWYITHLYTGARKIRVEGEELSEMARQQMPQWYTPSVVPGTGYLQVNTTPENSIEEVALEIVVDKSAQAATKNRETLFQIQQMLQSSPMLAETVPPQMLISLFDLPATEKRKMMAASEELMQARMEQQKAEAHKPPSLTMNFKDIAMLPAEMQQQAFALFGLEPTGEVMKPPTEGSADDGSEVRDMGKAVLTQMNVARELEFKKEKHSTQTGLKVVQMREAARQSDIKNRIALEKAKREKKTDAAKVR